MRKMMLVAVLFFAVACGNDGIPAPSSCPPTSGPLEIRMYADILKDASDQIDSLRYRISLDGNASHPPSGKSLYGPPPVSVTSFFVPKPRTGVHFEFSAGLKARGSVPGPTLAIDLDRNCDLLAELGLTPEGDELTVDVRWIERVE